MAERRTPVRNVITFRNSQGEKARGTLMKLTRSTVVMEVYNPYSIVQLSEVLEGLTIYRGDRVVYEGRAVVSNLVNTGLMLIVSATLLNAWKDLSGLLGNAQSVRYEVEQFIDDWEGTHHVLPGYQLVVGEIRSFFSEISFWLEQVDVELEHSKSGIDLTWDDGFFKELAIPVLNKENELLIKFEEEAKKVPECEVVKHRTFAQKDLHPFVMRSPFAHRVFTKPLGYAGDYEMVNMIFRDPAEGPTTYAKIINTSQLLPAAPEAHRNRIDMLMQYLLDKSREEKVQGKSVQVLNVACGPAIEVQRLIRSEPDIENCRFTLLDFNEETLAYTKGKVDEAMRSRGQSVEVSYVHESVHELLKQSINKERNSDPVEYDIVYCAGLFDYLSDKVCSRLLRLFYRWIRPGGSVLSCNVHPSNPNKYWMEHILEWHLIYRDEEEMMSLVPQLGIQRLFFDETGVNIFLEISKPVDRRPA